MFGGKGLANTMKDVPNREEDNGSFVSHPSNDSDIAGIGAYLGWHMIKAGLSSTCLHYLEVLVNKANPAPFTPAVYKMFSVQGPYYLCAEHARKLIHIYSLTGHHLSFSPVEDGCLVPCMSCVISIKD